MRTPVGTAIRITFLVFVTATIVSLTFVRAGHHANAYHDDPIASASTNLYAISVPYTRPAQTANQELPNPPDLPHQPGQPPSDQHGDTRETATLLPFGDHPAFPRAAVISMIETHDDYDYFKLVVTDEIANGGEIRISFYEYTLDGGSPFYSTIVFLDQDGNCLLHICDLGEAYHHSNLRGTLSKGTYYVRVQGPGNTTDQLTSPDDQRYYTLAWLPAIPPEPDDSCPETPSGISDPLYGCQYYLKNNRFPGEDINVEPVWAEGNFGQDINIVVVDSGIQSDHEDLTGAVDLEKSADQLGGPLYDSDFPHGTIITGPIAARHNSHGIRGIAPQANIFSYRTHLRAYTEYGSRLNHQLADAAVSNNSWSTHLLGGPFPIRYIIEEHIIKGITEGFGGKGTSYVFAIGGHVNSNYNEMETFYAVIPVCGLPDYGMIPRDHGVPQTNKWGYGANLWVCAHHTAYTTDVNDTYASYTGTSLSAAIVSGVVALVRSQNRDLTWRDVKLILAGSARQNDPYHPDWHTDALQYRSESQRYSYNPNYGFGIVDAKAAVDLAKTWTNLPEMTTATVSSGTLNRYIPDPAEDTNPVVLEQSLTITDDQASTPLFIEHVEIMAQINHDRYRDLDIELESPSGTISRISWRSAGKPYVPASYSYRYASTKNLGEKPGRKLETTHHRRPPRRRGYPHPLGPHHTRPPTRSQLTGDGGTNHHRHAPSRGEADGGHLWHRRR